MSWRKTVRAIIENASPMNVISRKSELCFTIWKEQMIGARPKNFPKCTIIEIFNYIEKLSVDDIVVVKTWWNMQNMQDYEYLVIEKTGQGSHGLTSIVFQMIRFQNGQVTREKVATLNINLLEE